MDDKELIEELRDAAETCISEGNFIWADFMKLAADRFQELTAPMTDEQIIDMSNKALPGWSRRDNDLAYIKVTRALEAARGIKGE